MPRFRTPGPGTYESPAYLKISGSTKPSGSAAFNSGTSRSGMMANGSIGDPGAYDLDKEGVHMGNKEAMSHTTKRSFNSEASKGRGSFNSTTPRPSSAPPKKPTRGGPGENDYSHMYSCGKSGPSMSSSFRSSSPLGGHIRKSSTPGVGSYDPGTPSAQPELLSSKSPKSLSKDGSSMFAGVGVSARSRNPNTCATGKDVGPGTYEQDNATLLREAVEKHNPRLPPFASSSKRPDLDDI